MNCPHTALEFAQVLNMVGIGKEQALDPGQKLGPHFDLNRFLFQKNSGAFVLEQCGVKKVYAGRPGLCDHSAQQFANMRRCLVHCLLHLIEGGQGNECGRHM